MTIIICDDYTSTVDKEMFNYTEKFNGMGLIIT